MKMIAKIPSGMGAVIALLWLVGYCGISSGADKQTACAFLTEPRSSADETAWRLFVAANCTAPDGKFTWENWIEKFALYPANGKPALPSAILGARRLHGSGLAAFARAAQSRRLQLPPATIASADQGCREIHKLNGQLPDNVKEGGTICEETRINSATAGFILEQGYEVRGGQVKAAVSGLKKVIFPKPSIEIKVMWIPSKSLKTSFSCEQPDPVLHTEMIDGECYAMIGMHVASKLYDNWLWATFEVKDVRTNPLRCIWFGPCRDTWGAMPTSSEGGPNDKTTLSPALIDLMNDAGIDESIRNFRLVGTQLNFVDDKSQPTLLGNSVIEGEGVGMEQNRSSCITCHAFSAISPEGREIDTDIDHPGPIGNYDPPYPDWMNRGFVWSLTAACPPGPKDTDSRCISPAAPGK